MPPAVTDRRLSVVVGLAVVCFAFWRVLFAGHSLVAHDRLITEAPFDSHVEAGQAIESGPIESIDVHAHWSAMAERARSGDLGWWNPDLAGGQPTMKGGLPFPAVGYLLVPEWFAPGLGAVIRTLVAVALMAGFLARVGVRTKGALVGGLAYALSGTMVGWIGGPLATVAALLPGLLWVTEDIIRRPRLWHAAPLGGLGALMVWANFAPVLIFSLVGVVVYGSIRALSELRAESQRQRWLVRRLIPTLVGAGVSAALAMPHLVGYWGYIDWVDTSHRAAVDQSALGAELLMTLVAAGAWGSDATGPAWFGAATWSEANAHAGAAVVLLALWGSLAWAGRDQRRRSVVLGLVAVAVVGADTAYVGSPIGSAVGRLIGDEGGLVARARVILSFGIASLAGLGVDRWAVAENGPSAARIRRHLRNIAMIVSLLGILLIPSVRHWRDAAGTLGATRQVLAGAAVPALATGAVAAVLIARFRRMITASATGWMLAGVVAVELLFFAMPVPTTVARHEQLTATPAHDVVLDSLDAGERLAGEGRTFWPNTTAQFGIPDARGGVSTPAGYKALVAAGGTDPSSPVWDALAVGVWAQFPMSMPPGPLEKPPLGSGVMDLAEGPLTANLVVPDGGLRAVVFEIGLPRAADVSVTVTAADGTRFVDRRVRGASDFSLQAAAVQAEDLPSGLQLTVQIESDAAPGSALVAVDDAGQPVLGTVAGDDDFRLLRTDDITLVERLGTAPVRVFDSAVVEGDPTVAARIVAERVDGASSAVVDEVIPLPEVSARDSGLNVVSTSFGVDQLRASVDVDRAALVVFSVLDHPGWAAQIDGQSSSTVTADGAFLGVLVPAGRHDVVVEFEPAHLRWTTAMFVAGLIALAALFGHGMRRGDLPRGRRTSY